MVSIKASALTIVAALYMIPMARAGYATAFDDQACSQNRGGRERCGNQCINAGGRESYLLDGPAYLTLYPSLNCGGTPTESSGNSGCFDVKIHGTFNSFRCQPIGAKAAVEEQTESESTTTTPVHARDFHS